MHYINLRFTYFTYFTYLHATFQQFIILEGTDSKERCVKLVVTATSASYARYSQIYRGCTVPEESSNANSELAPQLYLPTRGTASDVAGTIPATISWNTLSDSRMVIPA